MMQIGLPHNIGVSYISEDGIGADVLSVAAHSMTHYDVASCLQYSR